MIANGRRKMTLTATCVICGGPTANNTSGRRCKQCTANLFADPSNFIEVDCYKCVDGLKTSRMRTDLKYFCDRCESKGKILKLKPEFRNTADVLGKFKKGPYRR